MRLLRIDHLRTGHQFGYELPKKAKIIVNYFLYYIEYSNYFLAGFTEGNGVLAYDLTQSTALPARRFNQDSTDQNDNIAYLEGSRVLLINPESTKKIYGYSFFESKKIYHLTALNMIKKIISIRASDFYVVISERADKRVECYNLGVLVLTPGINQTNVENMIFSQYIGHLLIPQDNLVVKYTLTTETLSPICESIEYTTFSFTNKGCLKCSPRAFTTQKGLCEMDYENSNLPYLLSSIATNLPTNIKGETYKLEEKKDDHQKVEEQDDMVVPVLACLLMFLFFCSAAGLFHCCHEYQKKKTDEIRQRQNRFRQNQIDRNYQDWLSELRRKKRLEEERRKKRFEEERRKKEREEKEKNSLPPNATIEQKYERLSKDYQELEMKYVKLRKEMTKKEIEIKEREKKLQMEKEAIGLIKGEIQDGLPIEALATNKKAEIELKDIRLRSRKEAEGGVEVQAQPLLNRIPGTDRLMFEDN